MSQAIVPTLTIRTPEGVGFNLVLAGIIPRFLAWLVDLAGVGVLLTVTAKMASLIGIFSANFQGALNTLLYFVVSIGYGIFFEWIWRGQTPGKRLLRLRVLDVQALRLELSQIVIRNVLRAVDSMPLFYLVGGVAVFASRRCQRLGDLAANTIVVRYPKMLPPDAEQILGNKYNSLRDYPHLAARLRQAITPEEASIALEAIRRTKILDAKAQISLFNDLAAHFKGLVEFPPEAVELMASEQYIRNVADIVFNLPAKFEKRQERGKMESVYSNFKRGS